MPKTPRWWRVGMGLESLSTRVVSGVCGVFAEPLKARVWKMFFGNTCPPCMDTCLAQRKNSVRPGWVERPKYRQRPGAHPDEYPDAIGPGQAMVGLAPGVVFNTIHRMLKLHGQGRVDDHQAEVEFQCCHRRYKPDIGLRQQCAEGQPERQAPWPPTMRRIGQFKLSPYLHRERVKEKHRKKASGPRPNAGTGSLAIIGPLFVTPINHVQTLGQQNHQQQFARRNNKEHRLISG